MRRCWFIVLALLLGLLTAVPSGAADDDDEKVVYPKPGALIPGPFHVLNLTGPRAGRYHSLVVRYGLQPVAAVFIQPEGGDKINDWLKGLDEGQPLATLLKKLDDVTANNPDAMLGAFAVFSAGKDEELAIRNKLNALPKTLGIEKLVLAVADELRQEGMKPWQVKAADGSDPEVTVVIYNRHKVLHAWTFTKDKPLTEKDISTIATAFDKLVPDILRPRQRAQLKIKPREPAAKEEPKEPIAKEPKEKKEDKDDKDK